MADPDDILWTAGFLNERFPGPVSPLGWSVIGAIFDEYALRDPLRFMGYPLADKIPATRLYHAHPYTNVLIFQILYNPFPDSLVPADAVRYFPDGDVAWRKRAPYPRSILNPRFLVSLLGHFLRDPINWSPFNFWQWERYAPRHEKRAAALNARLAKATEPGEILNVLAEARRADADFAKIHRWSLTYADLLYRLLARLAPDQVQVLISNVPNRTREMNQELEELGQIGARLGLHFDSDPAIAEALSNREFAAAIERFVRVHGHRSFSLDIAVPTFREDPAQFLRLLASPARRSPAPAPDWRAARDEARQQRPAWQRPWFDAVLAFARRYATLRENERYYWHMSLAVQRRAYLLLASILLQHGVVETDRDIFYATAAEITSYFTQTIPAAEFAARIARRRTEWERYTREYLEAPARAYPPFLKGDEPLGLEPVAKAHWQGRGVSPGTARGRARIVLEAAELGRVEPGEVLVAPATDPGWTPVFARLAALVLERGGVLAHGAIVAREHHLPAVAGLTNITRELSDGDIVEVDGTRGTVRRISGEKKGSSRPAA